jgi:hypothetical protein
MIEYNIENVWQKDSQTKRDVIAMWLAENVLPNPNEAETRAEQLVMVARTSDGKIAGVCTAYVKYYPNLANSFYYYRSYISRENRHQGLASDLIRKARVFFNQLFQEGKDPRVIGLYLEVENEHLKQIKKTIWWRGMENFVFLGVDNHGVHHRVSYFDNARIS